MGNNFSSRRPLTNDKNEIKTQVIYLYHTRYMAIRLLVAHKNKTLEVSQI